MPKSLTPLEKSLVAYAVSAGVALAVAPAADAQIVYTDVEPDECVNFAHYFFDIDNDGTTDFNVGQGSIFEPLDPFDNARFWEHGDFEGLFGDNNKFMATPHSPFAQALSSGATISSAQNFDRQTVPPYYFNYALFWSVGSYGDGNWYGGNDAFVGVKFIADRDGAATTHYGWVRVSATAGGFMVCVHEFAYESTPDAPIGAGDRGADTAVTCTPVGPPIVIPAAGGSYAFDIEIVNNGATAEDVDIWFDIDGPGVDRTRGPVTRTLAAGASFQRTLNQNIPAGAPAGDYTHTCNVGTFPIADSSSSFDFEKSVALAPGEVRVTDWSTESEIAATLGIDANAVADIPGTHVLEAAYPNPFNPQSQFTLAVAREQHVTAELYNVLGQQVATLFDGAVEANASQIIQIDGSDLASGVYVVRVNGERFSDALRVTLLK